jgi:gluconolactonase
VIANQIALIVSPLARIVPGSVMASPAETSSFNSARLKPCDSRRGHIRAFDVLPNGPLAKQTDRVFADLRGSKPGGPDGMKVDTAGNVYSGGAGGIYFLDPKGKKLGRIVHGYSATTNIGFGGDD